jgi:hypothetical protein
MSGGGGPSPLSRPRRLVGLLTPVSGDLVRVRVRVVVRVRVRVGVRVRVRRL